MAEAQTQEKKVTQTMLVSDNELSLLKSVFADNDELLRIIRNLFLGLDLLDSEKELIKSTFADEALRALIAKRFLPTLNANVPVGQTVDLWTGVDVKGKFKEEIEQLICAREALIGMVKQAIALLENVDGEKVDLSYSSAALINDELGVKLIARNHFISHIEVQLVMIKAIAGEKKETVAEAKYRLQKNSNK